MQILFFRKIVSTLSMDKIIKKAIHRIPMSDEIYVYFKAAIDSAHFHIKYLQ